MVTRGTWRPVPDRDEWKGRRAAARAHLKTARNACAVADEEDDGRLIIQGAILAAIAYSDALTIKVAGIRNDADHQRLPATMRHALGSGVPLAELTRLTRLLARKDDSAYGHRFIPLREAREALEKSEAFAAWAEGELARV
ncbi:MAG TPA: hypothetical protein VHM30_00750 [Gemmatimonadaceae bacterium]|nr:hypothetical protein [Gemmatimonadaceae bacterium]